MLDAVPGRERLREAVARASGYARRTVPVRAGADGREFHWEAAAGEEKPRFMLRRSAGAPAEVLIDPNEAPDTEAPVFAVPSPDGRLVAYGTSVGNTHDAVIRVLEADTGRLLADRPRGTGQESVAWLPDSTGFLYTACPEPGEAPAGEEALRHAVYEHRIGAGEPARRAHGEDHDKDLWCTVEVTECGRYAVLTSWDFVHANTVRLLRLADRALITVRARPGARAAVGAPGTRAAPRGAR